MINRVLFSAFVFGCIAFTGIPAMAQGVPGCNPAIVDAMAKKNDALVGYDMSVVQESYDKPDSVLASTCFNKAAGLSATEGGKIFSEDFLPAMKDIIEPWLTAFYDEFDDAMGKDNSTVNAYAAAATTLDGSGPSGTANNCNYLRDWWTGAGNLGYKNTGVRQKIPFVTLDMLRGNGNPAGAGADFLLKWGQVETINNVKTQLDTALTALPLPQMPATGFTTDNTICAVLNKGGITCP